MKPSIKSLFPVTLAATLLITGCGGSDDDFNIPINPIGQPVAVNDSFNVIGNGQLQQAAPGVLANDTPNGATLTLATNPGLGAVTVNNDGSFTYTPNAGQANTTDTFTYTLTNAAGSSTATVTIQIGQLGSFVDNSAPAGGDGSRQLPFQTLAQAAAANGANPVVFVVAPGSGAYTENLSLQPGQSIQSSNAGQATINGRLTLSANNRVSNLRLLNSPGTAINATNASDGSIDQVTIEGATGTGSSLVNATGTFTFSRCTLNNIASHGLIASADNSSLTWTVSDTNFNNISGVVAVGTNITNTAAQNITVNNCTGTNVDKFVVVDANTTGTNVGLNMNNNTANGGTGRGLDILLQGSSNFLGLVAGNTITGMDFEGILGDISGTAQARMRFTNNRTENNLPNRGVVISHSGGNPNTGAIFNGNTSDGYSFLQNGFGTFAIGDFAQFSAASANVGAFATSGTINDVPENTLGIP